MPRNGQEWYMVFMFESFESEVPSVITKMPSADSACTLVTRGVKSGRFDFGVVTMHTISQTADEVITTQVFYEDYFSVNGVGTLHA